MATELAKAYVQIVPSARGLQGSLQQAMGGEAQKAGHHAGTSLASTIKNVLVTAGIGAALGKALTEGAALEQSIGGIETLFKDSAEVIKQRADEAYRTAGMSANKYMELTTSFSAALLKSLGDDTRAAADISDMAMTDMSDNANKMGTDMQRITDAYQGFAKQNYTMLDNLKLGYGGTQKEMQRLLADAQKITGIEYNIDNLADVYSAIHVIQGELDITGTTAKEAATTISGSAAAMKAAFSNVLGKLTLGQDIGPSLDALAETTTTFLVGNLAPAVWNIVKALPGALDTFLRSAAPQLAQGLMSFLPALVQTVETGTPQLLATAQSMVAKVSTGIQQNFPQMLAAGGQMLSNLIGGITNALPQLLDMAVQLTAGLLQTIVSNFPQIVQTGGDLLLKLATGIWNAVPQLLTSVARMLADLLKSIASSYPKMLKTGFDLIVKMIGGIGNAIPKVLSAAQDVVHTIWDTICDIDWMQLGKDIISGLIEGIGAMAGALWDAAKSIGTSVLDSIKGALDIHSPSRVMRDQVGKWIPAGVAEGIRRNLSPVRFAMQNLADVVSTSDVAPNPHWPRPAPAFGGGYGQISLHQTIHTHDSLTPAETTREAEDMLERAKWKIP